MAKRREEEEGGEGARRWSSGVLIGQGVPGRGKWCLGAVDLALGDSTASGRRRQRRCAGRGVVAARGGVWDACAREEVPRGGQVALGGFPGSIWPRARGGRSPPVAYGRRRPKQSKPGERDGDRDVSAISEIPGTFR